MRTLQQSLQLIRCCASTTCRRTSTTCNSWTRIGCTGTTRIPSCSCRSIVTSLVEPSLDSSIPERPCTIALIQDRGGLLYDDASIHMWEIELTKLIPNEFGMTFATIDYEDNTSSTTPQGKNEDDSTTDKDIILDKIRIDLMELMTPQIVLIARGPKISWLSQLYLESHSLAGLILVDPLLPLCDENDEDEHQDDDDGPLPESVLLKSILPKQTSSRPLLLEPGAIPMMILKSRNEDIFHKGAERTANRHRLRNEEEEEMQQPSQQEDDPPGYGHVPVLSLGDNENCNSSNRSNSSKILRTSFRESIIPWIESQVL